MHLRPASIRLALAKAGNPSHWLLAPVKLFPGCLSHLVNQLLLMMTFSATAWHTSAFAGYKHQVPNATNTRSKCIAAASTRLSYPSDEHSLCPVSYISSPADYLGPSYRAMPATARSAFKALERDTTVAIARSRMVSTATAGASTAAAETQSAIDTLCLVTYSDDEDATSSWQQQQRQQAQVRAAFTGRIAAAAGAKAHSKAAGPLFSALNSEDNTDEGLPGVMETLCMLSYDEESA